MTRIGDVSAEKLYAPKNLDKHRKFWTRTEIVDKNRNFRQVLKFVAKISTKISNQKSNILIHIWSKTKFLTKIEILDNH